MSCAPDAPCQHKIRALETERDRLRAKLAQIRVVLAGAINPSPGGQHVGPSAGWNNLRDRVARLVSIVNTDDSRGKP